MRFLSWIFLILTVVTLVLDWNARGVDGKMVLRPLGEIWSGIDAGTLATVRTETGNAAPGLLDSVLQPLLEFPAALTFGIAWLLFKLLSGMFRRRRAYRNYEPV